ncbi:polysaccharide biosynthesis protein [Paenibacillus polymyxa]|uniref:putative polysaccharide biosynthesis protein n=1 Tax=Paenibacillus polymyxa TaxID=1406 RepID=UPI0025B64B76|nr:polysaccharide biosynthesis protein [Paenibacillus polymyxa]MDN4080800.1 polysaccharide biosynthesis protein [Paenibacillus polymyxa]MDN4106348.1 polysaccharide biosynthesis protein [Paenibacillus polymyxa]MDN4116440.1 polysaccharide biosynthesis protein [Paenibacillus polymyxa]
MQENRAASRLLRGAVILTMAAVASKLIGTLQKIPLQNIGGDGVFGIYNTVYPFYTLFITIAAAGFPVAVSKFVAEYEAVGNRAAGQRVALLSSLVLGIFGLILGLLMYTCAPLIGQWIDNAHVIPSVRVAAVAFLFVPVMAGLRGYFQGLQNMIPTAVSQVTEQAIRVSVMIILLLFMLSQGAGADMIAAGAVFGSAAGGAAGLVIMLLYWRGHRKRLRRQETVMTTVKAQTGELHPTESNGALLKALLRYALPVCLGALAVPLINLVDTFTVPRLLKQEGLDDTAVMVAFGVYNRGLPLVQLVMMFATTLSALFIPSLAEARVTGGTELARRQCEQSLRWFWLLGLAAATGLIVLAVPVNVMLYADDTGSTVMRWMALTAVGGTLSIISAALLQGLGAVRAPALAMLAAAAAKALLNWLLVPQLGTAGAAIAGAVAYLLAAVINIALLARLVGLRGSWSASVLKPAALLVALAGAAGAAMWGTSAVLGALGWAAGGRATAAAESLLGVAAGAVVFVIGLARLRLITEAELVAVPKLGRPLAAVLRRLRVLA